MSTAPKHILCHLWQSQLIKEYDHINWSHRLKLIRPQINVVDVSSYYGQWDPLLREIKISFNLIKNYSWAIVLEIFKHEIAHQMVTDKLGLEDGHGPRFKSFCLLMGVDERFQKAQAQIDFSKIDFESCHHYEEASADIEALRLLQRVEKLLALAQSSNENEALAAMEKVSELYEKYNIDRLNSKIKGTQYRHILINLESQKTKAAYSLICAILMEHFFVEVIFADIYMASKNSKAKVIEIYGALENLKMAEYVFHFLVRKMEDLWINQRRSQKLPGKFKRSFQLGLLHGFNEKLRGSKRARHQSNPSEISSRALQTIDADEKLVEYLHQRHPRLRKRSSYTGRVYSSAFSTGKQEGKSIVLNKGIEKASAVIKLLS